MPDLSADLSLAQLLVELRHRFAEVDHIDPHSTLDRLPTADELLPALRGGHPTVLSRTSSGEVRGYGFTWMWREDDGTQMCLLDVWAVPWPDQQAVLTELFDRLETRVQDSSQSSDCVLLGANCRSVEPARRRLLAARGYRSVFDMVEMQAPSDAPSPRPPPAGITLRTAVPNDARAIADLTSRVWAQRPYFTTPSLADVSEWLSRAHLQLYLVAEAGSTLVGLASGALSGRCAEIDDVQVDPLWQRKGLATALLEELLTRLRCRSSLPVRLQTEGHDPAGARSLYARLGFTVVGLHHRYRRPLRGSPPGDGGSAS